VSEKEILERGTDKLRFPVSGRSNACSGMVSAEAKRQYNLKSMVCHLTRVTQINHQPEV